MNEKRKKVFASTRSCTWRNNVGFLLGNTTAAAANVGGSYTAAWGVHINEYVIMQREQSEIYDTFKNH
jgi:hypothetical protein